jgi:hypothetical protein
VNDPVESCGRFSAQRSLRAGVDIAAVGALSRRRERAAPTTDSGADGRGRVAGGAAVGDTVAGLSRDTWHALLTIFGAACEIVGLSWIVVEAARARSAEYGEHGLFRRIFDWFAFWLGPPGGSVTVQAMSGTATASGSMSGVVMKANESDVERIDRELRELRERVAQQEKRVSELFTRVEGQLVNVSKELGGRIAEVEARHRELRRSALRAEVRGARLFILGAVLSAIANLV